MYLFWPQCTMELPPSRLVAPRDGFDSILNNGCNMFYGVWYGMEGYQWKLLWDTAFKNWISRI